MIIFLFDKIQSLFIKKYLLNEIISFVYITDKNEVIDFILNNPNPNKYLFLNKGVYLIDYFDISIFYGFKCACLLKETKNKTIKGIWDNIIYFDLNLIHDFNIFTWNSTEIWLKAQIKQNDYLPVIEQLRWDKINEFKTTDIYFMKHLWSLTWNIEELPLNLKNKKKLIHFLKNDKRNKNKKILSEIYMNVFIKI